MSWENLEGLKEIQIETLLFGWAMGIVTVLLFSQFGL